MAPTPLLNKEGLGVMAPTPLLNKEGLGVVELLYFSSTARITSPALNTQPKVSPSLIPNSLMAA